MTPITWARTTKAGDRKSAPHAVPASGIALCGMPGRSGWFVESGHEPERCTACARKLKANQPHPDRGDGR